MTESKFPFKTRIITVSICGVLSIALIVGTIVASNFNNLIDNFFSVSTYVATEAEKECSIQIVDEGAVLLKNSDGALPLSEEEKNIAVFGQNSVDFVYGGAGSGAVDTKTAPSLKEALEDENHGGFTVDSNLWKFYTEGEGKNYRKSFKDETGSGQFAVNEVPVSVINSSSTALSTIGSNNAAIVTIGRSGGESSDLPTDMLSTGYRYLQVDKNELDTIKLACSKFNKVILIVNANNPVELGFLENSDYANVKSVLWVGGVGQNGMYSIADILSGKANPSGRLVDTYAYDSTSAPAFSNFGSYNYTNPDSTLRATSYLVYGEGIYVGYRYYETRYEDVVLNRGNAGNFDYSAAVQFPFGYGLSYTDFEYENFTVNPASDGKSYEVSVNVRNTGEYDGKEVVEIYAQKPYNGAIETSAAELVGFTKTGIIKKGETADVKITVQTKDLTSYDYKTNKTYVLDSGDYYLAVGHNVHDALNNILQAKGKTVGGNASNAYKFHKDSSDATTYSVSYATGKEITNRFDDATICKYDSSFEYLSRSDWSRTLVSSADYKGKSWTAPQQLINDLHWNRSDAVINDTSLPTVIWGSTTTSYKITDLLDAGYDDSRWDDIVNQLTWSQASKLVRIGGYSTMEIESIGLPSTVDKDGPSGISGTLVGGTSCMAWPAEVVMSSTWNEELIEEAGVHIGEDSISANVAGWYAPGVDIHRTPYSGRNFEYFSEDGFLSGKIGAAEMRGVRSMGVIAYMKHFALNDQETNRYGGAMFANEQEIREICLKGFEFTVTEGHACAAMAGMNRVGSTWAGAHRGLMTDVLRGEWGFEGMVITDQASVNAMYYQDMISGLYGGTDLWLNSNASLWPLSAVDETKGGLTETAANYKTNNTVSYYIHQACKRIIYTVTNSNAVKTYSADISGGKTTVFPWKVVLIILDIVFTAATLVLAGISIWLSKKEKNNNKE